MPQVAQPWMPGVTHDDRGGGTPVSWDGPTVIVLHTTETDGPASYSGTEPHFEVGTSTRQFVGLNNTSKALYNYQGQGVETNRRRGRIVQIEIVWRAANAPAMPTELLRNVAKVIAFVKTQFPDLQLVGAPQGFHGADEGVTLASETSPYRFSFAAWENFGGICAHQHVPENDHWDTGRINIERLIALVHEELGTSPAPAPVPEEDPMAVRYALPNGEVYVTDGLSRRYVGTPKDNDVLNDIGCKLVDIAADHLQAFHDGLHSLDGSIIDIDAVAAAIATRINVKVDAATIAAAVAKVLGAKLAS